MTEIGTNIDKVARSYQQAFSQLKEGKGNLISKAEKLRTLGIKAKKSFLQVYNLAQKRILKMNWKIRKCNETFI